MKTKVVILLILVFIFNGLSDARQLNDLSILSAVGIDVDENGEYIITSQVLNTQKSGESSGENSSGTSVVVYETKRKSVHEALRNTIEKAPKKLYIAHLEVLLISEEAAKKDILNTLDFFLRDRESSDNFMVVITKDSTPQEVLKILSATNSDPAKSIFETIKSTYEYEGSSTDYLLYDSIDMILDGKRGIVVASISLDKHDDTDGKNENNNANKNEVIKNETEENIDDLSSSSKKSSKNNTEEASQNRYKVTELAYFKDRKFKGYLEKNDAIIYNLLQNRLKSSVLSIDDNNELFTVEIIKCNVSLKPRFENNNFIIDIDVKVKGNITEEGKNVRENIIKNVDFYKQKTEDVIKNKINDAIDNYKYKYDEDIVGFEKLIYKNLNKYYDGIKDKFKDDYFKKLKTNINVCVEFPLEGGDMISGRI